MFRFFDFEYIIHSIKTVIACILGILCAKILGKPSDQWVVITICVVMCAQLYVGSVLQKSYFRLLGTCVGCLFATFTLVFFGHSELAIITTISIAAFVFSFLATKYDNFGAAGTLGVVTTAIIMLSVDPSISIALSRVMEIALGIVIATVVSQFVLPIRARNHLRREQANTLKLLMAYYQAVLMSTVDAKANIDTHEMDETIVKSILKQRTLGKESKAETLGAKFDQAHFLETLYYERQILRAITFMHETLIQIKCFDLGLPVPSLKLDLFHQQVLAALKELLQVIALANPPNDAMVLPNMEAFKEPLLTARGLMSGNDLLYFEGFISTANILIINLRKIAELYEIPVSMHD